MQGQSYLGTLLFNSATILSLKMSTEKQSISLVRWHTPLPPGPGHQQHCCRQGVLRLCRNTSS